jgi:hypothetical protein
MDDVGLLGGLSNPVLVRTLEVPPPPDDTPPAAIEDLAVLEIRETSARLVWTAPGDDGDYGTAVSYELRIRLGETITTEQDWLGAGIIDNPPIPIPDSAGTGQEYTLVDLHPGQDYGVALRAYDDAGNLGPLGPPVFLETPGIVPIDEIPPERIYDLKAVKADTTSILLHWTAPADSGMSGQASLYHLRWAPDGTDDEAVWEEGIELDGLPPPAAPGAVDSFRVLGLKPDQSYGFVLRSEDEVGNLSEASDVVWARTEPLPPPPPPVPPGPILDLRLITVGIDTARVAWTSPGADSVEGQALRYHVRLRTDGLITTEDQWDEGFVPDTTGLGRPDPAGTAQEWTLRGLHPATDYALAIRAEDDEGLWGALSNPLTWTTEEQVLYPPGPITDLDCVGTDTASCELTWTAPAYDPERSLPARYRLAYLHGSLPITTEEDWAAATDASHDLPVPESPGTQQAHRLEGLEPASSYAIAMRCEDRDERLGLLGRSVLITTDALPDTIDEPEPPDIPPGPIDDLSVRDSAPGWIELTWTAVGEDSLMGTATAYRLRYLAGETFEALEDWDRGILVEEDLPTPSPSGTIEQYRMEGLRPGSQYGFALRAVDRTGQLSPWVGGIKASVPLGPSPPPPVEGLTVVTVDLNAVTLRWSHPGEPGLKDGPLSFEVGLSTERITENNFDHALKHPDPPEPADAGKPVTLVWEGLDAVTTYWVAIRVHGTDGLESPLSNLLNFTTLGADHAPPDPPENLRMVGSGQEGLLVLVWDPSPSADILGYLLYGRSEPEDWTQLSPVIIPADQTQITAEACCEAYAISAIDHAGNESPLGMPIRLGSDVVLLRGPFPHPVGSSCRFEIAHPFSWDQTRIQLRVYSLSGRLVRTIYDGGPSLTGLIDVDWDRRDERGQTAGPGFNLLLLQAGSHRIERRIFLQP